MKVEGPQGAGSVTTSKRANKTNASGEAFATMLDEDEGKKVVANPVSATRSVDPLLVIQEVGDEQTNRKRAKKRGQELLDELDELRHGLLIGTIEPHQLHRLVALIASERVDTLDPELNAILDEIDLRAQVELAKLGQKD
jgi:hypothetical protein